MEKDHKFEKDGISYLITIRRITQKLHQIQVWQAIDSSVVEPKFGYVGFFNGEPYGKVGTDFDRNQLKRDHRLYPPPYDPYYEDIIEYNEKIKLPARQRAYSLIYEQCPWLFSVVHFERGDSIEFYVEELINDKQ